MFRSLVLRLTHVITSSRPAAHSNTEHQHLLHSESGIDGPTHARENNQQNDYTEQDTHSDAAATMLAKLGRSSDERIDISPEDDARVLRRIDIALLPLMLTVYFLQALDKATLSYASIFGLIDDTHLVGDQFSWLGSIVYVAQLVMQLPLAVALVKLPIGKFTSVMVLAWGLTLAIMTWARDFPQLMVARFFLGAFEASIGPSFVAITQMWWRRSLAATYALVSIDSSMRPYQIIFLFFGIVTVLVSVVMFYWMPDSPTEAKFLNDDDKVIAIQRLRDNQMGVMSREWKFPHLWETLADVKTWLWVVMIFCISVPSSGISTYGPQIIKSILEDPYLATLMNVPIGLSHVVAVSGSAYLSMRWKLKGPVIVLLCIPPIFGLSILLMVPPTPEFSAVSMAAYFCLSTFTGVTPLIYSWSAQNTAGDTKRKSVSALVFIGSSAGNMLGPLLFTPDNPGAGLRMIIVFFVSIVLLAALATLYLRWLNRNHAHKRVILGKRAAILDYSLESADAIERHRLIEVSEQESANIEEGSATQINENTKVDKSFLDMTDLENEDFIFVY